MVGVADVIRCRPSTTADGRSHKLLLLFFSLLEESLPSLPADKFGARFSLVDRLAKEDEEIREGIWALREREREREGGRNGRAGG